MNIKFNLFKPRKKKLKIYEPSAPPYYEKNCVIINDQDMVRWRKAL